MNYVKFSFVIIAGYHLGRSYEQRLLVEEISEDEILRVFMQIAPEGSQSLQR